MKDLNEIYRRRALLDEMNEVIEPRNDKITTIKRKLYQLADDIAEEELHYGKIEINGHYPQWHKEIGAYEIITEKELLTRKIKYESLERKIFFIEWLYYLLILVLFIVLLPKNTTIFDNVLSYVPVSLFVLLLIVSGIFKLHKKEYKRLKIRKIILNNLVSYEDIGLYMNSLQCYIKMKEGIAKASGEEKKKISHYLNNHSEFEDEYQEYLIKKKKESEKLAQYAKDHGWK